MGHFNKPLKLKQERIHQLVAVYLIKVITTMIGTVNVFLLDIAFFGKSTKWQNYFVIKYEPAMGSLNNYRKSYSLTVPIYPSPMLIRWWKIFGKPIHPSFNY